MARVKSGTRMAYISVMSDEKSSTWVTDHYNGLLDTTASSEDTILTEAGVIIQTEDLNSLQINVPATDTEIISISFVADDRPTPIQTVGEFRAT
jgi:hypothetical protein